MILLDYRDRRPIYEQVRDALRRQILTGALRSGDRLPSVRSMAAELAINPNTLRRAYTELEQEGFVATVQGKGCFVVFDGEKNAHRRAELTERVRPMLAELRRLGMTEEELREIWKGESENASGEGSDEALR